MLCNVTKIASAARTKVLNSGLYGKCFWCEEQHPEATIMGECPYLVPELIGWGKFKEIRLGILKRRLNLA